MKIAYSGLWVSFVFAGLAFGTESDHPQPLPVQEEAAFSAEPEERLWPGHRNLMKALDKKLGNLETSLSSFLGQNPNANACDCVKAVSSELFFVFLDRDYVFIDNSQILAFSDSLHEEGPKKDYSFSYCIFSLLLKEISKQAVNAGFGSQTSPNETAFRGPEFLEKVKNARRMSQKLLKKLDEIPETHKPITPTPEEEVILQMGMRLLSMVKAEQQNADRSKTNNPE